MTLVDAALPGSTDNAVGDHHGHLANHSCFAGTADADRNDPVLEDDRADDHGGYRGDIACEVVVVMFIGFFFGAASWRPGETSPEVTQALNDLGWLGVLFTGAPFALFQIALAVSIFMDRGPRPAFPRWSAYFNLFSSFFMCEASLLLFFKTGPFSQNGVLVFYIPMIVFFSWIILFTVLTVRAINAESAAGQSDADIPGLALSGAAVR